MGPGALHHVLGRLGPTSTSLLSHLVYGAFSGHPAQSHHEPYLLSPLLRKEPETTATASRGLRSIQGLGSPGGKGLSPKGSVQWASLNPGRGKPQITQKIN